ERGTVVEIGLRDDAPRFVVDGDDGLRATLRRPDDGQHHYVVAVGADQQSVVHAVAWRDGFVTVRVPQFRAADVTHYERKIRSFGEPAVAGRLDAPILGDRKVDRRTALRIDLPALRPHAVVEDHRVVLGALVEDFVRFPDDRLGGAVRIHGHERGSRPLLGGVGQRGVGLAVV